MTLHRLPHYPLNNTRQESSIPQEGGKPSIPCRRGEKRSSWEGLGRGTLGFRVFGIWGSGLSVVVAAKILRGTCGIRPALL